MTLFIPDWTTVLTRHSTVKRALNALDDDHTVRRPLRPELCAATLFVEHPRQGWAAVALEEARFADVDPSQLFESTAGAQFEKRLADLQALATLSEGASPALGLMVVMLLCSADEVASLARAHAGRHGVRFVTRDQFSHSGAQLVQAALRPVSPDDAQRILGAHFPEAEIPSVCTTRRFFHRDNSAKLPRHFLDQQQEWASKLDLDMPLEQAGTARDFSVRVVNGVAGSGKTLIALNRALLLADLHPDQNILILIHNAPIVADLKHRIHQARQGLPANLTVKTFFGWAASQWRAAFDAWPPVRVDSTQLDALIAQAAGLWPDLKYSANQLRSELDFINDSLVADEEQYLEVDRTGRVFALRVKDRSQIWAVREAVSSALRESNKMMWSDLPRGICLEGQDQNLAKYDHIIVDEAQFFAPSWFQVVKRSLAPGGQVFLCADPNQGFMKNKLSWKSVGFDVNGRVKKLRWSYRTTREILEAANHVLASFGRGDAEDYLEPDFAGMASGERPRLIYTDSSHDSLEQVVNEVVASGTGDGKLPLSAMLIVYGGKIRKSVLYEQLCRRLPTDSVWWFAKEDQKDRPPGGFGKEHLRMVYLDAATGLEAHTVFLVGMENLFHRTGLPGMSEDEQLEQREEQVRKLYMAMTRAGQRLVLVSCERLPEELERLFERMG
jgi:hypothetical protein